MATSPQLALSEAHRDAQNQLAEALTAWILAAWTASVVPGIPSETMAARWIAQVAPYIFAFRERSADLARGFYERQRLAAGVIEPLKFAPADLLELERLETSLKVTGIIGLSQKVAGGMDPLVAFEKAGDAGAAAGARHALDGGRSFVLNAVRADKTALGYYRQTREGCCFWCAMLASRGVVFKEDSFTESDARFIGDGDVKVHDGCHCIGKPVWSRDETLPDLNEAAADLWHSSTKGVSGSQNQRLAFRRAWEARAVTATGD